MKKSIPVLLALSMSWPHCASAGPSGELKVHGVIKPAACTLVFANGGKVDMGVISRRLLNAGQRNLLRDEPVNFTITCDAPTRVSLNLKDNRAGSAAASASWKPLPFLFGLGKVDSKNVGAYTLSFDERPLADQKPARMIATENKVDWDKSHPFLMPNRRHSWTTDDTRHIPTPFATLSGVIVLAPSVVPASELPSQDEIPLDGMASFELNYL